MLGHGERRSVDAVADAADVGNWVAIRTSAAPLALSVVEMPQQRVLLSVVEARTKAE